MNIKDAYIHNGEAILKDIQVSGSKLQKLKAGKDANDAYLTWVDVLDFSSFGASGHNHDDRYLKLAGNTTSNPVTGPIYIDGPGLFIRSKDATKNIWEIVGDGTAWSSNYGFYLQYYGAGSGNNNDLILYSHGQASTDVEVYRVHQDGSFIFKATPKVGTNDIYHAGNLNIGTLMGSTAIGDSDEPVYWSGSAFTKCGPFSSSSHTHDDRYLKLTGGTLTGVIERQYNAASNEPVLKIGSANKDIQIFKVYSNDIANYTDTVSGYGYSLQYIGSGSGVTNYLRFVADNSTGTKKTALSINQSGQIGILADPNTSYALYVNGNTSINGDITATTIKKSGGTSSQFLKADGSVDSNTYSLSSHDHDSVYIKDILLDTGNSTDKNKSVSLTNGNVYLKLFKTLGTTESEDSKVKIYGDTNVTVTTDSNGDIKIIGSSSVTNAEQLGGVAASSYFKNRDYAYNSEWTGKFLWTIWDNNLYAADKRFNVTVTGTTSTTFGALFDGCFEGGINITESTAVLHIKHKTTDGNVWTTGLPYGNFYLVFYNSDAENVTGRVYCNYSQQGIGWHDLTVTHIGHVWILSNGYYQLSDLEITITKPASSSSITLCQVLHQVTRSSGPSLAAVMSKYCNQVTDYNITANKFIGPLQGNADSATYTSNVGSAGTAGTNYVTAAKVIATCNWYDTMTGSDTDAVINRWSEIVDFVANFEETPDLATYLSNNYLAKSGGTMTGQLKWKDSNALPEQTSPQYFLCIEAFTNGGATKWTSKANTLKALTGLTSTAIGDTDEPVYWDGSKFVKAGAYPTKASWNYDDVYLKLSGGTLTGALEVPASTSSGGEHTKGLNLGSVGHLGAVSATGATGVGLYSTEKIWIRPGQTNIASGTVDTTKGLVIDATTFTYNGNTVYHSGNLPVPSTVSTITRSTDASHYLVFVDSNNTLATAETLYTSTNIIFNPNKGSVSLNSSPTSNASKTNYLSAGPGYSTAAGKYGVKVISCDQSDCQTGLGQDLGMVSGWSGWSNTYNLSIAGGNDTSDVGKISFVTHKVNSTTYRYLGGFLDTAGVVKFNVQGDGLFTGSVGVGTSAPGTTLDVRGITSIYPMGEDNTLFKGSLIIKQQNSVEGSNGAWDETKPSFGIQFNRFWTSSNGGAYGETPCAGMFATVSSSWRAGLVFRTKNNTTNGGTHDVSALILKASGAAVFASTVTATSFVSTVATGTQPYACTSTTVNEHLNADLLDGFHAADFRNNIVDLRSSPQTFNPTYLKDIVFISEADYTTLVSNGSITKNSITHTYNTSNWYVIEDKVPEYAENAGNAEYASVAGRASSAESADKVEWSGIQNKPLTATRWPSWSEVTNKPTWVTWSETSSTATYSLSNATWTQTITLPTAAGSYILKLVSGNSTLTGVFSIGASDNAKDEISLHLHGNGPRLYARTNGTKLELSRNIATATNTSVTITYRRMI